MEKSENGRIQSWVLSRNSYHQKTVGSTNKWGDRQQGPIERQARQT